MHKSGAFFRQRLYHMTMKIGYARVSTTAQNLDRQIGALRTVKCDEIFREKASGKSLKGRPQLERAIDALGRGDVLVIAEWDRATRSMFDGISIIQCVADREALVKVLDKPWLDSRRQWGKGYWPSSQRLRRMNDCGSHGARMKAEKPLRPRVSNLAGSPS